MRTENQCERVKIMCICSSLISCARGYVVFSCKPFGKQASSAVGCRFNLSTLGEVISRCIISQRICLWFPNSLFQAKTKEESACWHWHSCFGGLRGPLLIRWPQDAAGGRCSHVPCSSEPSKFFSKSPFIVLLPLLWPLPFRAIFVCHFQPWCTVF